MTNSEYEALRAQAVVAATEALNNNDPAMADVHYADALYWEAQIVQPWALDGIISH